MVLTGAVTVLIVPLAETCRFRAPPPPVGIILTGLPAKRERLWGLRNRGVVIRLGVEPALVLANSKFPFPSMDVMAGRAPLDARAVEGERKLGRRR